MADKRQIHEIIVHCADTPPTMDVGVAEIRRWHIDPPPKGNGWSDIGYHFVIRRNGTVERGRPLYVKGAHVRGHNEFSIGICLVGGRSEASSNPEFNFTADQARALRNLITSLLADFGDNLHICGHRDYDPGKACPCFDVKRWWETGRWSA